MSYNEDSDDDDWFYNSFKRYDDLLMYDVHGSISSASFMNSSRLLLAASGGHHHEVWELSIPKKLIAGKDAGLTRDRDFSIITAGYTKGLVKKMLPFESGFVTSESNGVNYYCIPDSSDTTDIIQLKHSLRTDTQDVPVAIRDSKVFSGTHICDVSSIGLGSDSIQTLPVDSSTVESLVKGSILPGLISELDCKGSSLYMCLQETGEVLMYDLKENVVSKKLVLPGSSGGFWTMDVSDSGSYISVLSSDGALFVYDSRNLTEPLLNVTVEVQDNLSKISRNHICVQLCPSNTSVSVSGLSKNIQIFDLKDVSNVFNHDGHRGECVQNIVTHLWHKLQDNLVFSADNTGQLQAWRFKVS